MYPSLFSTILTVRVRLFVCSFVLLTIIATGSAIREHYWSSDSDSYLENKDGANEVMEAIVTLDKAMLKSDLLFSEYQLSTAPHCDRLDESLAAFEPLALPMPLIDGNYPWFPDACFESNE